MLAADPLLRTRTGKPQEDTPGLAELARARALVLAHGWNSTSHQVLDRGMRRWFSRAGDAVVGYVSAAGLRVVAGAPVAPDERLEGVAAEFEADARRSGEQVCYFAAEERFVAALGGGRHVGHVIGLQPIWEARSWGTRFDAKASLRAQRNRAANKGVTVAEEPAATELGPELRACHAAWLRHKRLPRLRFLAHSDASRADPRVMRDRRLFVARWAAGHGDGPDPGRVVAYLCACPVPRRRGWLVEKVVRHPAAPNGTAELLIDAALRALAAEADRLTLGLAPLATVVAGRRAPDDARPATDGPAARARDGAPAWLSRLERAAVRHGRRLYDFAGLQAFKGKFDPDAWEPVYLLSTEPRLTPRTLLALGAAFLVA